MQVTKRGSVTETNGLECNKTKKSVYYFQTTELHEIPLKEAIQQTELKETTVSLPMSFQQSRLIFLNLSTIFLRKCAYTYTVCTASRTFHCESRLKRKREKTGINDDVLCIEWRAPPNTAPSVNLSSICIVYRLLRSILLLLLICLTLIP